MFRLGHLSRVEKVVFVVLLLVLAAGITYNAVQSVRKSIVAYERPSVSITVEPALLPALAVAACLPIDSPGAGTITMQVLFFQTILDFYASLDPAVGSRAAEFNSGVLTTAAGSPPPGSSVLAVDGTTYACVQVDLPSSARLLQGGTQMAVIVLESSTGGAFGPPILTLVYPQGPSLATISTLQSPMVIFPGFEMQGSLEQEFYRPLRTSAARNTFKTRLDLQRVLGETNRTTVFFSAVRSSYLATIYEEYVAFDFLDCMSSIFAWLSISAASVRVLFPVLPFIKRARFFVLSRVPVPEEDEQGKPAAAGDGADGTTSSSSLFPSTVESDG